MKLLLGDNLVLLRELPDNSVDTVITSPPYDNLRTYNGKLNWDFYGVAEQLLRVLKSRGVIVWIVADATINGSETGTSFRHALHFLSMGLCLHDTMIWAKGTSPFQQKNRYIQSFEYMFVLSKGPIKSANLIMDRKNKWAGTTVHGTETQQDGTRKVRSGKQKSKLVKPFGARLNIWEQSPEKNRKVCKFHPAMFPVGLAADHIRSWTPRGGTVLDPFMGSGSTGIAAKNEGFDFIGMEIEASYFEIAEKRINHP